MHRSIRFVLHGLALSTFIVGCSSKEPPRWRQRAADRPSVTTTHQAELRGNPLPWDIPPPPPLETVTPPPTTTLATVTLVVPEQKANRWRMRVRGGELAAAFHASTARSPALKGQQTVPVSAIDPERKPEPISGN